MGGVCHTVHCLMFTFLYRHMVTVLPHEASSFGTVIGRCTLRTTISFRTASSLLQNLTFSDKIHSGRSIAALWNRLCHAQNPNVEDNHNFQESPSTTILASISQHFGTSVPLHEIFYILNT